MMMIPLTRDYKREKWTKDWGMEKFWGRRYREGTLGNARELRENTVWAVS